MSRTVRTERALLAMSVATLALLSGCTMPPAAEPSASPSTAPEASSTPEPEAPSRPALADIALSSEGLGTLRFGQVPESDPALSMIAFNPTACTDAETGEAFGIVAGDPLAGAWVIDPAYIVDPEPFNTGATFGAGVDGDAGNVLTRIDLYSGDIPTDGGVRIGDDRADVVAGHPGATLVESYLTDIYVITGPTGILQIEVASRSTPDEDLYWDSVDTPDGRVLYIHAVSAELGVFSVAASGNIVGGCNFG